jgi:hypothetical protein
MKKIFTALLILMSIGLFAQNPYYSYKVKLQGVENIESSKVPGDYLNMIFKSVPTFSDSLNEFEFTSQIALVENGFKYLMQDDGYKVIFFERKEIVKTKE